LGGRVWLKLLDEIGDLDSKRAKVHISPLDPRGEKGSSPCR